MAEPMTDEGTRPEPTPARSRQQERAEVRRLQKMLRRAKVADKRFRNRAIEGVEFYFGRQWRAADRAALEGRGQPVITINRVKPTIKLIHGLMVSQPMDWQAKPVGQNDDSLAESGTAAIKHVANANNTEFLTAKAYWWSLTYGVGWAYVGIHVRDKDPRTEPVQARLLDSREVRLDPQCSEDDISDARYAVWSRKVDLDDAKDDFPKFAERLAGQVANDDPNLKDNEQGKFNYSDEATPPVSMWDDLSDWNAADKEDADEENEQVILHELWEKVPVDTWIMEHRDGWVHEFDPANPEQAAMVNDPGVLRYYEAKVPKVRISIFCGPLLLKQEWSEYNHGKLPFIPVWHERDEFGDPVSFVEAIKDPQREINSRRSRAIHEMSSPNVRFAPGLLERMGMDEHQAMNRFLQGGHAWAGNDGDIEILSNPVLTTQQVQFMQDSKAEIQATSGANDDLMGYDSSSKSGVAKQTQIEQGQTMQRPNEHNLKLFRKSLGEMYLSLIQQYHTDEWVVRITDEVGKDKLITLNQRIVDPITGQSTVLNDINQTRFEVTIDNMPWTPTLRQRASDFIANMASNEQDPMIRLSLQRMAIQASDIPERAKLLDIFSNAEQLMMGQLNAQQQMQQQQAEMQGQAQQQQLALEAARLQGEQAKQSADGQRADADQQHRMQQAAAAQQMEQNRMAMGIG